MTLAKGADAAPASADQIGAFPLEYDTDALPARRAAAMARWMTIIAVVLAFVVAAQGFALAILMPLQKIVPMVVTGNSRGDEIIRINPATLESPTNDYITEINLRNYVTKRYSIVASAAEQTINWGPGSVLELMSTPEAYGKFGMAMKADYDRLRASGMIRNVRIDSVRKIGPNLWQVEYMTTDQAEGAIADATLAPQSQSWVSTYAVTFEPKNVRYSDRLNNPFGMTVVDNTDARRD
ncbi:type IV secretion system protein [Sphingosinicella sp. BN140058]|uniref:type IV secretion system protein n=1 Tax=Sphingosinicella sp. BN140058 TaxID=1892855 RepID=UPI0013ECB44B|nr:type IV secretion system protein [Sphingosinicella sp. BN140058]